jgi:hypothetical protein
MLGGYQVRICFFHVICQTIHGVVAHASALEVGIVLRRAEEFLESVAAEKEAGALHVAERIAHGELALAADALQIVVSGAVHAVDAHVGLVGTFWTLDTCAPPSCRSTPDTVEAVRARVALVTGRGFCPKRVRALPARHAPAVRVSVGVHADGAIDAPRVWTVLVLTVDAPEATCFVRS